MSQISEKISSFISSISIFYQVSFAFALIGGILLFMGIRSKTRDQDEYNKRGENKTAKLGVSAFFGGFLLGVAFIVTSYEFLHVKKDKSI
jgi:hypothetical protein